MIFVMSLPSWRCSQKDHFTSILSSFLCTLHIIYIYIYRFQETSRPKANSKQQKQHSFAVWLDLWS